MQNSTSYKGIHPKTCFNHLPQPLQGNGVATFEQFMKPKEQFLSFSAAIQCLANTFDLTEFFLQHQHQPMLQNSALGSKETVMVSAWSKMINKMWNEPMLQLEPSVGGEVAAGIIQYGDLNYRDRKGSLFDKDILERLLGALSKELLKVDGRDQPARVPDGVGVGGDREHPDWAKNKSIISDLFQGEYKHVLQCQGCSARTTTKDPFLIMSLPVPVIRKTIVEFLVIPYSLKEGKKIQVLRVKVSLEEDDIYSLREQILQQHGIDPSSFLVSGSGRHEMLNFYNCWTSVKQYLKSNESSPCLLHEIPRPLRCKFPSREELRKGSNTFMVPEQYICITFRFGDIDEKHFIPRIFFAKESWPLLYFHRVFYVHMKDILGKWHRERLPNPEIAETLAHNEEELIKALNRTLELWMPELDKDKKPATGPLNTLVLPYLIRKATTQLGFQRSDVDLTVLEFYRCIEIQSRVTSLIGGKGDGIKCASVQIDCLGEFSLKYYMHLLQIDFPESRDLPSSEPEPKFTLDGCLKRRIKKQNRLRYCQACRQYAWNSRLRQISHLPPILIISMESNTGRDLTAQIIFEDPSYLNTKKVDFPLDGLDMSGFQTDEKGDSDQLYDCYAVITADPRTGVSAALVRNTLDRVWRRFEGEQMTEILPQELEETVVANSATTLFYRRRDEPEKDYKPIDKFPHLPV